MDINLFCGTVGKSLSTVLLGFSQQNLDADDILV